MLKCQPDSTAIIKDNHVQLQGSPVGAAAENNVLLSIRDRMPLLDREPDTVG